MSEPRFYIAADHTGEPTIWETRSGNAHQDQVVLVRTELPASQRDLLWNVLVATLTRADEQVDQAAMIVRSTQSPSDVPWADLSQGVRDNYREQVRHVLAALTEVAAQ